MFTEISNSSCRLISSNVIRRSKGYGLFGGPRRVGKPCSRLCSW